MQLLEELRGEGRQLQGEGGLPDRGQEAADSPRHLDQRRAPVLLRRPHQRRQAEEPAARAPGEDPLPPGEPLYVVLQAGVVVTINTFLSHAGTLVESEFLSLLKIDWETLL